LAIQFEVVADDPDDPDEVGGVGGVFAGVLAAPEESDAELVVDSDEPDDDPADEPDDESADEPDDESPDEPDDESLEVDGVVEADFDEPERLSVL